MLGVIFYPAPTWKEIKTGQDVILELLIVLLVLCSILGLTSSLIYGTHWAPCTFIPFAALLISSILIRFASPRIRQTDWKGSVYLVVFSAIPLLVFYICSMIFGGRIYWISIGTFISLLVFFIGLGFLLGFKFKEIIYYGPICISIIAICFYLSLNLLAI